MDCHFKGLSLRGFDYTGHQINQDDMKVNLIFRQMN